MQAQEDLLEKKLCLGESGAGILLADELNIHRWMIYA